MYLLLSIIIPELKTNFEMNVLKKKLNSLILIENSIFINEILKCISRPSQKNNL